MDNGELTTSVATEVSSRAELAAPADGAAAAAQPPLDRRAALAEMMQEHGKAVLGFCLRVTQDAMMAEDVTQQVFLEAYRDLDRFEGRSSPRTWLFSIASHRCFDALRNEQRRTKRLVADEEAAAAVADPGTGPFDGLDRRRLGAALDDCMALLSPDVRATVLLRFQTGLGYRELAEMLGASADTLQVRVSRALPVLKRCMERKGWNGD